MKLATQTSYIVKNPPPGFGGRYFIFVTLTTSCGITGTGEIYAASFAPEVITAMASDIFQRYLDCLLYTSPSPRDRTRSRMPSSA